ncbi:MAG: hypothetical protein JWM56_374 [Candidatus Peribacteria bacterium]|nr:hypothetical protein [Candidatus Peribacteria bacterium]
MMAETEKFFKRKQKCSSFELRIFQKNADILHKNFRSAEAIDKIS